MRQSGVLNKTKRNRYHIHYEVDIMEYASNGKANAGLTTGIIGTALAGLLWANGGNGGLGGILGGFNNRGWGNGSVGYGPCYSQSFEGKVGELQSEIAYLQAENYADKVANEVYKSLDNKISSNLEKLYGFVIDLDKRTALNAQGLMYENQLTNAKIDCCCDKANMQIAFNKQLSELADASIISYVNSNFIPGTLKLPITSICPQPAPATTTA